MKKLTFMMAALVAVSFYSCNKAEDKKSTDSEIDYSTVDVGKPAEAPQAAELTSAEKGKNLVEKADCLSCHTVDTKLIGPSYQDVAAKYTEADINQLATKIIQGSKGVWGEIPMTAHAGLSEENAHKMVKYILSLKK